MTGSWLTLNGAATRISEATGQHVSIEDVLLLGERDRLKVRNQHGEFGVLEESVTAYLAEHVDKPTVGRWSRGEDPDAFADRGDYTDTPSDEGDEL